MYSRWTKRNGVRGEEKRAFGSEEINRGFFSRRTTRNWRFRPKCFSLLLFFSPLASLRRSWPKQSKPRGFAYTARCHAFPFYPPDEGRRDTSLYFMRRHLHRRPHLRTLFINKEDSRYLRRLRRHLPPVSSLAGRKRFPRSSFSRSTVVARKIVNSAIRLHLPGSMKDRSTLQPGTIFLSAN